MTERHTVQKDKISAALRELHQHPTAAEVCAYVQAEYPGISRATVYRVLDNMARQGKILRIPVADGADHFDYRTHLHYHIYCDGCGRVDDVKTENVGSLLASVQDACGYAVVGYTLLFHGCCPACREKK